MTVMDPDCDLVTSFEAGVGAKESGDVGRGSSIGTPEGTIPGTGPVGCDCMRPERAFRTDEPASPTMRSIFWIELLRLRGFVMAFHQWWCNSCKTVIFKTMKICLPAPTRQQPTSLLPAPSPSFSRLSSLMTTTHHKSLASIFGIHSLSILQDIRGQRSILRGRDCDSNPIISGFAISILTTSEADFS